MNIIARHTLNSVKKNFGQSVVIMITMVIITACSLLALSMPGVLLDNAKIWTDAVHSGSEIMVETYASKSYRTMDEDALQYVDTVIEAFAVSAFTTTETAGVKSVVFFCDTEAYFAESETATIRSATNDTVNRGICVSELTADALGIDVGDTIELSLPIYSGGELIPFFVERVTETKGLLYRATRYAFVADISEIGVEETKANYVLFYMDTPDAPVEGDLEGRTESEFVADAAQANFPNSKIDISNSTEAYLASAANTQNIIRIAVVIIVLLMVYILFSSYSVIARSRIDELIHFKAAGATPFQSVSILLFEVFVYSLIGCTIGVFVGGIVTKRLIAMAAISSFYPVTIAPQHAVSAWAIGVLTGLLSCLAPSIRVGRKSIRQMKSGTVRVQTVFPPSVVIILGVVSIGLFIALFFLNDSAAALYLMIALIPCCAVWITATVPYFLRFMSYVVSKLIKSGSERIAVLATPNNRNLTAFTSLLVIVMAFIWAGTVIIDIVKLTQRSSVDRYDFDYEVTYRRNRTFDELEAELERLLTLDHVSGGCVNSLTRYKIDKVADEGTTTTINLSSGKDLRHFIPDCPDELISAFDGNAHPIIISYSLAEEYDIKIGDELRLYHTQGRLLDYPFTVVGIETYITSDPNVAYVCADDAVHNGKPISITGSIYLTGDEGCYAELRDKIENVENGIFLSTRANTFLLIESVDIEAIMSYFLIFAYVVSLAGLINNVILVARDRRTETNTYVLSGMSKKEVLLNIYTEGVIIIFTGWVFGLSMAACLNYLQPVITALLNKHVPFTVFPIRMLYSSLVISAVTLMAWIIAPLFYLKNDTLVGDMHGFR